MASLEGDNLVVFYFLSASENWPDKWVAFGGGEGSIKRTTTILIPFILLVQYLVFFVDWKLDVMRCHCGHNCMIVGFTIICAISPITTEDVSLNPVHSEVYSIQHYVIEFVSNLRQVHGFLWILRFSPPQKLTTTI